MQDRVILITGGSRGIGFATAECLVRAGARVVITGRDETVGQNAAQKLCAEGEARFVTADAGSEADCQRMVEACLDAYGRLDGAFNNAGQEPDARQPLVHEYPSEDWQGILDVHLSGLFYAMKHEIPPMLKAGRGSIVNMASVYGTGAQPVAPPSYVASKHGAIGVTRTAAVQYAPRGIRVNVVCPAFVRTPMFERAFETNPEMVAGIAAMHPMGRLAEPSEVADAVAWLLSDTSSFVTGNVLMVDGGMSAQL
jgi:NAD(P)-dependent dehydrogenase (short-subunit alcohol dehydrogenase family)